MTRIAKQGYLVALTLSVALTLTSCKGCNNNQQPGAQAPPGDPTAVNEAPVGDQSQPVAPNEPAASSQPAASTEPAASAAPTSEQSEAQNYPDNNYYSDYSESEPAQESPDPPPSLPDYQQPECPGPNYIWTPGYWAWGSEGYYWVPGVWALAPYAGALWTPGYWGFSGSLYRWHPGYWGPHIGFYGGINYGFGYIGVGYQGGFWSNKGFVYNTAVNNVNVTNTNITNVYNRTVYNYSTSATNISYNGGAGGIQYKPDASELAAAREHHVAARPAQTEVAHAAAATRTQFASVNRGQPQLTAKAEPVPVKRITPPAEAANPGIRKAPQIAPEAKVPVARRPAVPATRSPQFEPKQGTPAPRAPEARPAAEQPERRGAQPGKGSRPQAPVRRPKEKQR